MVNKNNLKHSETIIGNNDKNIEKTQVYNIGKSQIITTIKEKSTNNKYEYTVTKYKNKNNKLYNETYKGESDNINDAEYYISKLIDKI